ncbi:TIGR00282 family metallophosphoesterase [Maritalea sp. S77]|uniref:TIGR00282 family metallophosphoesterase n=1 Tax=Maritalea sp. S77 TaxID=3415125 RepID=UPI003C7A09E4
MRILFLGDVMGRAGRQAVMDHLPRLKREYQFDFVIINGENASHGRGLTEKHFECLLDAGADMVTLGDHAFDQRETLGVIARDNRLLRPINMSDAAPGRGAMLYDAPNGQRVLVVNALGRVFMNPIDDPFYAVEKAVSDCPLGDVADAVIVDFHAEATSEMQAMGQFLDGRASLVVGTHTHIPTADHRVLKGGTGLMSDAGMCGDYDSVIGMEAEEPVNRFVTGMTRERFTPAEGNPSVCGVVIETDNRTGLCTSIQPLRVGGSIGQALPDFA